MSKVTYTATGQLDLKNNQISLDVALPDPPLRSSFDLTYYNLSKKSNITGDPMNVILCEFTFLEDPGDELPTPTSDSFGIVLDLSTINKPPGLAGVMDFDFTTNEECLFLFFHSTDADADDRQALYDDMENLYSNAQNGPYVICPAPQVKPAPPIKGRPRAAGGTIITV